MVGKLIAGRYHLVRMLGDGGMGAVYKAADQVLRRFVAIKMLHPSVAQNPSSVERFEREARAAAGIGHPNIIDILDFGREQNQPYMVMEYLRGRSLSQVIAMDGKLDIKRAATIAIHTLAGLQSAHDRSILHRDLKPANLMLVVRFGDRNFVKVCDFGFAALFNPKRFDAKSLTPERTLVGTPAYAAPERLRGDDRRDPRLDVYSVGVLLYEMLAGRRPFDAPTFRELARKVRKEPPPALRSRRADVPADLEHIVMRSLAKDREDRWPSAGAMAEALYPYGGLKVAVKDDRPSDSFTMEMMRLKARETKHRTNTGMHVPDARRKVQAPKKQRPPARQKPAKQERPTARPPAPRPDPSPLRAEPTRAPRSRSRAPAESPKQPAARPRQAPVQTKKARRVPSGFRPEEDETQRLSEADALALMRQLDLAASKRLEEKKHAPPAGRHYRGGVVLAVLRFVSRKFGERALKVVLDSMTPEARRPFSDGIAEDNWVKLEAFREFVEQIDAKLGQDDLHLVLEAGRAGSEGAFDIMRAIRPPGPPAELLVAEMPDVFKKIVAGMTCEVRRVGRGYGRLELNEDAEPSLTLSVFSLGLLARSLEHFGADDVEVNLLSAQALGDPQTLVDISWFA